MVEIARLERTKAKKAPAETFSTPAEIVQNLIMTRGEKLAALRLWRSQLLDDIAAWSDEISPLDLQRSTALLVEIEQSIASLSAAG